MRNEKYRPILVAGLVAGLVGLGIAPCQVANRSCPLAAVSPDASHSCCCKVKGDCRCGPTCCQSPAGQQDRAPLPPRPADESLLALSMSAHAGFVVDAPHAAIIGQFFLTDNLPTSAESSLRALSVRLNV